MKKFGSKALILILLVALGVFAAGCGSSSTGGGKKYVVGTDAAYAPFEYMNEKGEIVGTDIEFVKALAEAGGFEVEFRNIGWEPLFTSVQNGEVDFAVSAITITDERKQNYDFSDPYFVANQLILVPADSNVTKLEDLKDKTVGVQINTTGHNVVKELLGETSSQIKAFETTPIAITELENKGVDAVVADNAVVLEYIKNNPNSKFKTVEDSSFEKEYYGLMLQKGNTELLKILNDSIKKVKESGKLKEIFGQDLE